MFVPLTPLRFRDRAVQLFGNKVGIVDGDQSFTYAEFGARTHRLANALRDRGASAGDRVAFVAYNSHPLLEGYFGVLDAGCILLPINVRLTPSEIGYILNDAGVRVVFVDRDFAPLLDLVCGDLRRKPDIVWLTGRPDGRDEPEYEEVLAAASADPGPVIDFDENDVAELFYTSGTTGPPKGVMLTHRNLYLHALSQIITGGGKEADVQLHTIPLFHVNGWGTPQALTAVGGTHVMMRRFDPGETLRLVEERRVNKFLVVPTMLNMILNHPDVGRYDLSSLELVTTGGAPTPPAMLERAETVLGCRVVAGYGLSETTPVLTFAADKSYLRENEHERIRRQASTGLPCVGVDLRIVDSTDRDVPWNGSDVGEIVVRSNHVMKGYWNDQEATDAVLRDGWFHTGDMAVVDPEGYFLIVDRKKDIIVSGGENISSVEVEKVLYEHPAVFEAAVIGVPDERWGEVPRALVVLRPGAEAGADELMDYCRSRIAGFKVPRVIDFVDSLPKGGTGKILKTQLREPFWQGQEKRVH